ncbi:MAG TPA: sugar phosphate nucleotidyltransferase [Anaerolineae bacterium]|nr:sugar phosphate nucleotidyltransferase [Anaerolineae bacterium]
MKAVVLAGGRGRRLAPYTTILPKPLMPVGDVAILEVVIRQLKHAGVAEITMAVGYLAELLMAYLGDGSKFGLRIRYSREDKPLGTAGPLSLIEGLDEPFLLMNGDLLTTLDYRAMWEHHCLGGAIGTLATFERSVEIDLGVIETNVQGQVTRYLEKPTYHYTVSTGIYVFDPLVLSFIPQAKRLDLPELVSKLLAAGHRIATYPFEGYWLDIGRHEDYERAITEFEYHRAEFLPVD